MGIEFRAPNGAERGVVAPGRGEEEFAWMYEGNPAGSVALAAFEGGSLVAHAGLVSRHVVVQGKERRFAELVDLFETKPGHLVLVARALIEEHGGPKDNVVITVSPEGERGAGLEKLLGRMLGFETLRTGVELVRDLTGGEGSAPGEGGDRPPGDGGGRVEELDRFDEQARWLFDRCVGDWLAMTLRDAAYLNWRFVDRPGAGSLRLGVRDGEGILRAFGVVGLGAAGDGGPDRSLELLDWLCPPTEGDAGRRLLSAIEEAARGCGARFLRTSLPPTSPWFVRFQERGYRVRPTGRPALARSSNRRLDDLALRDGLFATAGDDPLRG